MVFSSISFLCFFLPAVLTAYYVIPFVAWRNAVLLLASLLFYAWGEPTYVFLMIASILFNYNCTVGGLTNPIAAKRAQRSFAAIMVIDFS